MASPTLPLPSFDVVTICLHGAMLEGMAPDKDKITQVCPACKSTRLILKWKVGKPGFTGLCFECSLRNRGCPTIEQVCPGCKQTRPIKRAATRTPAFTGLCIKCSNAKKRNAVERICPQCGSVRMVRTSEAAKLLTDLCLPCSRGVAVTTHGESRTRLHRIWRAMKGRCCNPAARDYPYYGGRGITICERWLESYENFRDDMGYPPDGTSLERIKNSRGYEPGNCRWATRKEQMNNTRGNRPVTYQGRTQNLSQWAAELGVTASGLRDRIEKLGWSVERALTTPGRTV